MLSVIQYKFSLLSEATTWTATVTLGWSATNDGITGASDQPEQFTDELAVF